MHVGEIWEMKGRQGVAEVIAERTVERGCGDGRHRGGKILGHSARMVPQYCQIASEVLPQHHHHPHHCVCV